MTDGFDVWFDQVKAALQSINMRREDWQGRWLFDFRREFAAGTSADNAANTANRFWWRKRNEALQQGCSRTAECWLQRGHQGPCQPVSLGAPKPTYEPGDYVKVEFPDETTGVGEWMWVRVIRSDEGNQLLFGVLDNEPLNDYDGAIDRGSAIAVQYSQVREHRKPTEFKKQ